MLEEICNCKKCLLYKNQKPLLDKKNKCDVMWVGLSAKKVDDLDLNYPLENNTNSGRLIEKIENENQKYDFYKSNLVKCLPLNEKGKIRYPDANEMNICFKNLMLELQEIQPKLVFLLGNITYTNVIKNLKLYLNNCEYVECSKYDFLNDIKFIKIEHPSYICVYKRKFTDEYINKVSSLIRSNLED